METNGTIPALFTADQVLTYNATTGVDVEYAKYVAISVKDESSSQGCTVGFFCPSIDVRHSQDALRQIASSGELYIPKNEAGSITLPTQPRGQKFIISSFELTNEDTSFWRIRPKSYVTTEPTTMELIEDPNVSAHQINNRPSGIPLPTRRTAPAIGRSRPEMSTPANRRGVSFHEPYMSPTPRQSSANRRRYPQEAAQDTQVHIPVGELIQFETGITENNTVEIKGKTKWKEGNQTIQLRGPLGPDGRWHPDYYPQITNTNSDSHSSDSSDDEGITNDELNRTEINDRTTIQDEYRDAGFSQFGLGSTSPYEQQYDLRGRPVTGNTRPTIPARPPRARTFNECGAGVQTRSQKNVNTARVSSGRRFRSRHTNRNLNNPEYDEFEPGKPLASDSIYDYIARTAEDHMDRRTFNRVPEDESGVEYVTRKMLNKMITSVYYRNNLRVHEQRRTLPEAS